MATEARRANVLCRLSKIQGLDAEYEAANRDLSIHSSMGRIVWFARCWSISATCLYGQANFKWESNDVFNWKLACPLDDFLEQDALKRLAELQRIEGVISRETNLLAVLGKVAGIRFHKVSDECSVNCSGVGASLTARLWEAVRRR